jgi:hypothetical protein
LTSEQREAVSHGREIYKPDYGVTLRDIEVWHQPRLAPSLVPSLHFIENKISWGSYLQGDVRGIGPEDYAIIAGTTASTPMNQFTSLKDVEDASEFALENHLEDFMFTNWRGINFHSNLRLYAVDGQNGRQFPAGPWFIDFLCIDEQTGDFVVIELKKGRSSDAVVGQVLRYIAWVKENLAEEGQGVRGIVIAREADESLKYSVKAVDSVSVLTYRVSFSLSSP